MSLTPDALLAKLMEGQDEINQMHKEIKWLCSFLLSSHVLRFTDGKYEAPVPQIGKSYTVKWIVEIEGWGSAHVGKTWIALRYTSPGNTHNQYYLDTKGKEELYPEDVQKIREDCLPHLLSSVWTYGPPRELVPFLRAAERKQGI
jgi:hypothetical protein